VPLWATATTGASWLVVTALTALAGCGEVEGAGVREAGTTDSPAPVYEGPQGDPAYDDGGINETDDSGIDTSDSGVNTSDGGVETSDSGVETSDGGVIDESDASAVVTSAGALAVSTCPAVPAPVGVCGASQCGNGQIDSCMSGTCNEGGCTMSTESCDGDNLGGATCVSLGFSGGTLACNGGCEFDVSGCNHCGTGSMIDSCGNAALSAAGATSLAIASNATNVAIAWANGAPGSAGLNVAVLGSDLTVQSQSGCLGDSDVGMVAIAATANGWIVAAETGGGIEIQPLTPGGVPTGPGQFLANATVPILASNPSGGPLLAWASPDYNGWVSVLGADGTVTSSAPVFYQIVEPEYGSAVFVGDGFLVGIRGSLGATVAHVGLDGTIGTPYSLGDETEYPKLSYTGTEARVVYSDFSEVGAVEFQRLDTTGAPIGTPQQLGSIPEYYGQGPNTTVGSDSVVVMSGYSSETGVATHLDITRVTQSGSVVYSPYMLATVGKLDDIWDYSMAPIGSDMVVAWLTAGTPSGFDSDVFPATIGIARITP
jgi:hypothetical protein